MFARVPAATIAVLALFVAILLGLAFARPAAAVEVPPGFSDARVTQVDSPTAVAFTPDERMLITTQPGQLRVREDGVLLSTPALDLENSICANSNERGLLGVAVDPQFAANRFIYLYYTFDDSGTCVNRVKRYTLSGNNVATSSKVLIDNIPSTAGNHNGGDLHFGKDGLLYVSVGDGGCDYRGETRGCAGNNDAARDKHVLLGKILRVTRDGGIPQTNPYTGANSARCNLTGKTAVGKWCRETFASGLRNPFRMAFDPDTARTRFFINDVGQNAWEEVDKGKAGADYGWNFFEGNHDNPDEPDCPNPELDYCDAALYTDPVHEYSHEETDCSSITGGAFVPNNGSWPDSYDDAYLFADYVCGKIFKLKPKSGGGYASSEFATELGRSSAVAMTFGPFGDRRALYYTTYADGGEIRRIDYTGAPTAAVSASPTTGPSPLAVDFNGSGSSDPNGDPLTYLWSFGDGTSTQTATPTANHTYSSAGEFEATLRVRNPSGATSTPVTVRIDAGNAPPSPSIQEPTADARFRVGQEITLSGGATDPENGPLPDEDLRWQVIRHHNGSHTHPYFSGTGNDLTFEAPPPEDLYATGRGNYLEIRLTATDSEGLSRTVTQKLRPRRVDVTFETAPVDLELYVNGATIFGSRTLVSWPGYGLNVEAPRQDDGSGQVWVFESWSDGRPAEHEVVTPASAATYTATFKRRST